MKNHTRAYRINQDNDVKFPAGEVVLAKFALSPSGQKTYVVGEAVAPANPKLGRKKRKATPPWSANGLWSKCNLRLTGIQRIIQGRHGGPVDTDDARTYFDVALVHLAARRVAMKHAEEKIMSYEWAEKWTPALAAAKGREWFIEQERRILNSWDDVRPYIPTADEVADALQITAAEIKEHAVKTIGAVDRREGIRIREAKTKHAERGRARRSKSGAAPRAASMARTKPWEALGISHSTYKRQIANGILPVDPRMRIARSAKAEGKPVLRLISSK